MNFNYYISQSLISNPFHGYSLPTSSCKFEIKEEDKENFLKLYHTPIEHHGIGSGELAMYWLFNNTLEDHKKSDLIYNGKSIEIKSYPNHNAKTTLGKFKSDDHHRYIINSLFSYYNQTQLYPNYFSEVLFTIDNITGSFDKIQDIKDVKINELKTYLTGSTIIHNSINLIRNLTTTKLNVKPGHDNYVFNIKPKSPLDIWCWKIDLHKLDNLTYEQWRDIFEVSSSEIKIRFNIFN